MNELVSTEQRVQLLRASKTNPFRARNQTKIPRRQRQPTNSSTRPNEPSQVLL